jgi:toxin CptA
MSIATSVVVKPSRLMLALVGVLCLGVVFVGIVIGLGMVGELPTWQRMLFAISCILLAPIGFLRTVRMQKFVRLDISGTGQIRLSNSASRSAARENRVSTSTDGTLVSLLPDSTIWPRFLLLRLQAEDGKVYIVPIWPDSLPAESLRAVAVACRWVAAHNQHL